MSQDQPTANNPLNITVLLDNNSYGSRVPIAVSVPHSRAGEQLIGEQLVGNNWLGNNEWGTAIGEQLSTTVCSIQKTLAIAKEFCKVGDN